MQVPVEKTVLSSEKLAICREGELVSRIQLKRFFSAVTVFLIFFLIGGSLLYSAVLVSGVQWYESTVLLLWFSC